MARQKQRLNEIESAIIRRTLPANSRIGSVRLLDVAGSINLPEALTADTLDLRGSEGLRELPAGLRVRFLNIARCPNLRKLPADLQCVELNASESGLREIPAGVSVEFRIDLTGCVDLRRMGDGLAAKSIHLGGCSALEKLPEGMDANFLTISGCTSLEAWPATGRLAIGGLSMRDCPQLGTLPGWLGKISQLNISGCVAIQALPEWLTVSSWIDLAGTSIRSLPPGCRGAALRWRGVFIDERIAFQPLTIDALQVLAEPNAEMRRVLLERMGYEQFMAEAKAEVIDRDRDAGGERKLVKVPMPGDEDLVCVMLKCPSTSREYVIRVPPTMPTCRKAVAWMAGFDDEAEYQPLIET